MCGEICGIVWGYEADGTPIATFSFSHPTNSTQNVLSPSQYTPPQIPLSYALGAFGMPARTAYCGFLIEAQPKKGETVLVSGAEREREKENEIEERERWGRRKRRED